MKDCCPTTHTHTHIYKLATLVEDDPKAPFSKATALRCRRARYSFHGLLHFTLDTYFIMLSFSKEVSSTIFWVFGMTRLGTEPRSPEPLANALSIGPMTYFVLLLKEIQFLLWCVLCFAMCKSSAVQLLSKS